MNYAEFFQDKLAPPAPTRLEKVLCIIEGQSELLFVRKIYELCKQMDIECSSFLTDIIQLSWGKSPISWTDKARCKFQGGNIPGSLTPQPVLESLHKENIGYYKAVLVMFDADVDEQGEVHKKATALLASVDALIFLAEPCFEKEVLALTFNQLSQPFIDENYQELGGSKCRWFKQNWQAVPKQQKFIRSKSSASLLPLLGWDDLSGKSPNMDALVDFVASRFS